MQSLSRSAHRYPDLVASQLSAVAAIGLLCFGGAMALNSLHTAQVWHQSARLLGALLLYCASGQILCGVVLWRRQQPFPALVLVAFGLFWFSRLAFDILPSAGIGTPLSAPATCGNLLLWGLFALILSNADECPRLLRLGLYGIGGSLLLQATGTLLFPGPTLLLACALGCGAALTLAATGVLHLRRHFRTND